MRSWEKKIRIKPEEENKQKVTGPTFDQRRSFCLFLSLSLSLPEIALLLWFGWWWPRHRKFSREIEGKKTKALRGAATWSRSKVPPASSPGTTGKNNSEREREFVTRVLLLLYSCEGWKKRQAGNKSWRRGGFSLVSLIYIKLNVLVGFQVVGHFHSSLLIFLLYLSLTIND